MSFPRELVLELFERSHFHHLSYAVIDFSQQNFVSEEWIKESGEAKEAIIEHWFDLASISKILNGSLSYFVAPKLFDEKLIWLLNHQAGLPSWAILSRHDWKNLIWSYELRKSPTLYSDLSVLRLMLELEKKSFIMKDELKPVWDGDIVWWRERKDLVVHDPNARNLNDFCSHAGLFSTTRKLSQFLIKYYQMTNGFEVIRQQLLAGYQDRFILGFDRVLDPKNTLAGTGCSEWTIGHLGFVGTSVWMDLKLQRAVLILSDCAQMYWYQKEELNHIRRVIGQYAWGL